MSRSANPFDAKAIARRIDVDSRLPLRYYYRTADSLLKQADIYRSEKNVIDLYAILLRYSSLVSDTIPKHQDYQTLHKNERKFFIEKLRAVVEELESLKPEFTRLTDELKKASAGFESDELISSGSTPYGPETSLWDSFSSHDSSLSGPVAKQLHPANQISQYSWNQNNDYSQKFSGSFDIDKKFQTMSLTVPVPKQETLSRHSFLGQNGLRGQWQGPSGGIKISYPSQADFTPADDTLNQDKALASVKEGNFGLDASVMESILSLDDGRWSHPAEDSYPSHSSFERNGELSLGNIRQPNPPPVLAQVHPEVHHIPPSRVADPRPGPAKPSKDEMHGSQTYQHLHIPVKLMQDFLRFAERNTRKNLETCGILAGSLKNRVFHISHLIIPKQESTSDSCQTVNEEEIFEVQDKLSLFPLGWIHTHPTQTCFMSSVDLHTHYSYQIMLPEAIAIVMAPTDTSSPHGIFHLSDPGGVSVIRNCQQRGFHPHEEPLDGSPLYEHSSHVYMNPNSRFEVLDLR